MPSHCRHEPAEYYAALDAAARSQQTSNGNVLGHNDGYTHLIDQYYAPEKHFEPWDLNGKSPVRSNSKEWLDSVLDVYRLLDESCHEPDLMRNYGWDEIEQSEDDEKRLRQLLSIWDAERIAILKLQHDLDKNVFTRTFDYIKRIGQSVGLALWLWTHRPANCSNIANYFRPQQPIFTTLTKSKHALDTQCFGCPPCPEMLCCHVQENEDPNENTNLSCLSSVPLDSLPDSLWLKRFVLDDEQEYLPPIARAMKNMLDHNMILWNPQIQMESSWPHFVNKCRVTKHKRFLRNMHDGHIHFRSSSSPQSLPSFNHRQTTNEKDTVITRDDNQTRKIPVSDVKIKTKLIHDSPERPIALPTKPKITISTTNNDRLPDKQQQPPDTPRQSLLKPPQLSHQANRKKLKREKIKYPEKKAHIRKIRSNSKDKRKKNRSTSKGQKSRRQSHHRSKSRGQKQNTKRKKPITVQTVK